MTMSPFPALSPSTMPGDSSIINQVVTDQAARQGRRIAPVTRQSTSIFTQAAEELSSFKRDLKAEMKAEMPAPFMQRQLSRKEARDQLANMSFEQKKVMMAKMGVANFLKFAMKVDPPKKV